MDSLVNSINIYGRSNSTLNRNSLEWTLPNLLYEDSVILIPNLTKYPERTLRIRDDILKWTRCKVYDCLTTKLYTYNQYKIKLKDEISPGWCASVCRRFDSQSGHKLGLLARFLAGGMQEAINQSMFLSHTDVYFPLSLPSPLSKNKYIHK